MCVKYNYKISWMNKILKINHQCSNRWFKENPLDIILHWVVHLEGYIYVTLYHMIVRCVLFGAHSGCVLIVRYALRNTMFLRHI